MSCRIIARLDVKAPNLIKGIHLEGLRKIGDPNEYAIRYYHQGADEILYMDSVASLYERNSMLDIVQRTSQNIFVPITVGGGIRSLEDAAAAFRAGADKVALNTAAINNPQLIQEIASAFGSQAVVLSVEAKQNSIGSDWEAYTDNGRERTGRDVMGWVQEAESLGCGEVLLTSVDREGTKKGFDLSLVQKVSEAVSIPVIASGGFGGGPDAIEVVKGAQADAVAVAAALHYEEVSISDIRTALEDSAIKVRKYHVEHNNS